MDTIYKADPKTCHFVSEKINIKEKVLQLSEMAKEFQGKMVALKLEHIKLGKSLSIDTFSKVFIPDDDAVNMNDVRELKAKPKSFIKPNYSSKEMEGLNLETVQCAQLRASIAHMHNTKRKKSDAYDFALPQMPPLKYRAVKWIDDAKDEDEATETSQKLIPNEDCIVTIRIYHPFKKGKPKQCQDIVMHGRQTLEQLRAMIACSRDLSVQHDMSLDPKGPMIERAYDTHKSCFIFINNVFYNATRSPTCTDTSAVIREWAASHDIRPLTTSTLENTHLLDLTLQLGYPYVFQHLGDCEHIVVFTDVRLVGQEDGLEAGNYPYIQSIPHYKIKMCMVCSKYMARWKTVGSNRVPVDPCLFCEVCFYSYNYVDGKKVGEFKAYPYIDQATLI